MTCNPASFAKIVAGEIPCKKVYEDDALFAFEDANPAAPTHILIIPKRHMETLHEIQDADKELIGSIFVVANEIARKRGIAQDGFRIVANCGENGGQTVLSHPLSPPGRAPHGMAAGLAATSCVKSCNGMAQPVNPASRKAPDAKSPECRRPHGTYMTRNRRSMARLHLLAWSPSNKISGSAGAVYQSPAPHLALQLSGPPAGIADHDDDFLGPPAPGPWPGAANPPGLPLHSLPLYAPHRVLAPVVWSTKPVSGDTGPP